MIPWLAEADPFPPLTAALLHPNGLLAATPTLSAQRLIAAYTRGIFPWYGEGEPVLWWSPDPRMVLPTAAFKRSRSLGKTLARVARGEHGEIWIDRDFEAVMRACAAPRAGQPGTWITEAVIAAYCELHQRGLAHSVETWIDGQLAGGLYGVALGRMFYGESMFARVTDASKIALATLVTVLQREGVPLIDCQQATSHLASLGARPITRRDFSAHLKSAVCAPAPDWPAYAGRPLNELLSPG
ncbi:MAG: leucyl/phenylalanyl-tRNA--protein transferase [Burkholderiaceae bacterium]